MNEIIVEETGLPLKFPDPREEARARAEEFRRLSPDQRMESIRDVLATGNWLLLRSPRRELIDRMFLEREKEWQRIHRELFRHAN